MLVTLIIVGLCVFNAYIGVRGQRAINVCNELYAREAAHKKAGGQLVRTINDLTVAVEAHKHYAVMLMVTIEEEVSVEMRERVAEAMLVKLNAPR